ncbi:WD40 repeat-like protein [Jaminaea rosea]|uniref:WD40 repeat-like protein n=1 Tax=Jaminaea rosea TaxID=1569628 RepID=A0A316V2R1_9BASI|nr:WD40 repeat-like protein [Jaminaea rosea]PWN29715.1 WD40 repeat-like protein [Jaminaea rosea]
MSNASGAGGNARFLNEKSGRLKLSKKEGLQSLPVAGTSDISITRDWEGPEGGKAASTRSSKPSGLGPRADRFITTSRTGGPSGPPLLDEGGGDTLSSASAGNSCSSSGDESSQIAANIAAAQMAPNEVAGNTDSLESACNVDMNQRILSYSAAPPNSANPDIRSRYAAARPKTVPSSLLSGGRRKIPTEAEKVLDAPGMINDFYYHLIDWSSTNLVAVALQSVVHVWNGDTGEVDTLCDLEVEPERVGGGGMVTSVRWDCDGAYLSIGTDRGYVQLWDVASAQRVRTLKPSADGGADNASVNISAWAPDGTFSCGYSSGLIREHDVRERDSVLRDLPGAHVGHVSGLEWRADSALLASGGNDNVVKVWDRRTNVAKMRKENHQASVKAIAWCPWNSSVLATGGGTADRAIHFWNVTSGTRTHSIQTDSQITGLHWSTHYREIVSTHGNHLTDQGAGGAINLWSHPACSRIAEIKNAHDGRILHTALSPDGQILATVGTDENLKFWRVFGGKEEGSGGKGGAGAGAGASSTGSGKAGGSGGAASGRGAGGAGRMLR